MIVFRTPDFTISTFKYEPQLDHEGKENEYAMPHKIHHYNCDSIAITDEMLNCDILVTTIPYYNDGLNEDNYEVTLNGVMFYTENQQIARLLFQEFINMKNKPEEYEGKVLNEICSEIGI